MLIYCPSPSLVTLLLPPKVPRPDGVRWGSPIRGLRLSIHFFYLFSFEEMPASCYTTNAVDGRLLHSWGGDVHDDLREVSTCAGFPSVGIGAPGSAEISI